LRLKGENEMKCWICEKQIEEGEPVIEVEFRNAVMMEGQLETTIRMAPRVLCGAPRCREDALKYLRQYWKFNDS